MYETFFNLRERPFELTPNPKFLLLTARHAEALSNLEYGMVTKKAMTLLLERLVPGKRR
jgi:general secretion pathway protein A